jgi:hypothetical protein
MLENFDCRSKGAAFLGRRRSELPFNAQIGLHRRQI